MFHNESLPEGLQEVADSLSPKFAITCIILFSFCVLSAIVLYKHDDGLIAVDWLRSKPAIALAGKINFISYPLFNLTNNCPFRNGKFFESLSITSTFTL